MKMHLIKRWITSASANCLTIFQYHKIPSIAPRYINGEVEAKEFSRVLTNYLAWFNFLPLEEAYERLEKGELPACSAAITFDDGYSDWFEHIVPMLSKNRVPATFFITSGQLGKPEPFWHERIANAIAARADGCGLPKGFDWGRNQIGLNDGEIAKTILVVQEKLKYMALEHREEAIFLLESGLPKDQTFRPFLHSDVIKLRDAGFQIGAHSRRHPILSHCSSHEALDEIAGCKEELEGLLHDKVTQFAYPNGRPGSDFSLKHIDLVKRSGYRLAVTTSPGVARAGVDPFQLPRFTPWSRSDWRSAIQIVRNMRVNFRALSDE